MSPREVACPDRARQRAVSRRSAMLGGAALALGCAVPSAPQLRARASRSSERAVTRVLDGLRTHDGAGVSLLRHVGHRELPDLDPFVLLDEMQSSDPREYAGGFPTHPHRGFETVTVMIEGAMRHRDSVGNAGLITGGGAQWMTAGSGILHSEMPETTSGELWGFQLWVNLRNAERWRPPHYQDLPPERIAEVPLERGGALCVIAGEALGARGPVELGATRPFLATVRLARGDDVELPLDREHEGFVVIAEGEAEIGRDRNRLGEDRLALLSSGGTRLRVRAPARDATLLVVAGHPLRERYVHRGPFVMETEEDIARAFADYRAGRLGT